MSETEEERRRRQEMNMFAAFATGSLDAATTGSSTGEPHSTSESSQNNPVDGTNNNKNDEQQRMNWTLSMVANQTGSFALRDKMASKRQEVAEKSNLNAALAALSQEGTTTSDQSSKPMPVPAQPQQNVFASSASRSRRTTTTNSKSAKQPMYYRNDSNGQYDNNNGSHLISEENIPMFAEEVLLPRPLFFGAILPPRVLEKTQFMVQQAVQEYQSENNGAMPRLQDMPSAVRNMIGVIRTYGYGLDEQIWNITDPDNIMSNPPDQPNSAWQRKGNPYVSTFQPVWGSRMRAERVQKVRMQQRKIRKPRVVSRSTTAPARMSLFGNGDGSTPDADSEEEELILSMAKSDKRMFNTVEEEEEDGEGDDSRSTNAKTIERMWLQQHNESMDESGDDVTLEAEYAPITKPSEQETFSKWALGSGDGGANESGSGVMGSLVDAGTFQLTAPLMAQTFRKISTGSYDGDEDSVINDEQKKQVGMNDHLRKAVALLAEDGTNTVVDAAPLDQSQVLLSQVPLDSSQQRPLTNYEVTSGCVPLFGVDDPPLPQEADLGTHETKEEQLRSLEQKRSEEIIEKFVPPNVFGPLACPNPALNPDDFHSWNAQMVSPHRISAITGNASIASEGAQFTKRQQNVTSGSDSAGRSNFSKASRTSPKLKPADPTSKKPPATSRKRYGWWNEPYDDSAGDAGSSPSGEKQERDPFETIQLPPANHSATSLQVTSALDPTPEQLRNDNLPLSRMHAATSIAQTLPYLCDRPHTYRYLQIDAQAIAFPPIKGDIEPLFCSLAIYNVETISSGMNSGAKNGAPVPDLQRCGRVTEALHFDYVVDPEIESRCNASLWPFSAAGYSSLHVTNGKDEETPERLQGTRCGVFPLPSNLNVANLYAVLIVRKVISDDSDFEPYLRPTTNSFDLEKFRLNAQKASEQHGQFVLPFAFGVAPLLQVFGTDNPVVASSRAVQIPLFRFSDGERQIIDHIMVMLFPRADHKANGVGGPAPVTNGGTAMLVMRNFGYLGLHAVVDNRSSLARDRLVDFTGELQLRRRNDEELSKHLSRKARLVDLYQTVVSDWRPKYVAEPALLGGRNCSTDKKDESENRVSDQYAQELAPLPLMLSPSLRMTGTQHVGSRGRASQDDIEPFYHTSFCNELLCHPRILHNCPKGRVSLRVELREMEWNETLNTYFAHVPRLEVGPSIHNPRRGPFLVHSAFTSCTPRCTDHQFIDEFKMKLPLDLDLKGPDGKPRILALFFTVFRLKSGNESKWKMGTRMFFGSSSGNVTGLGFLEDAGACVKRRIEQVACGFLPLTSLCCLLDSGLHDVRIVYKAKIPSRELCEKTSLLSNSFVLDETAVDDTASSMSQKDSTAEDTTISNDSHRSDLSRFMDSSHRVNNKSEFDSQAADSLALKSTKNAKSALEPISLSVRIVVYSTVHSQNTALTNLLQRELDVPPLSYSSYKIFLSTLRMGREHLISQTQPNQMNNMRFQGHNEELVETVITVTDHQHCPIPRSTSVLFRVMQVLWRSFICGDGEPDLVWANPASSVALRVHSFATILHLVGATSLYMAKHGVTQVDGTCKWNVVVLGRILALMFDEGKLFGHMIEKFDDQFWSSIVETTKPECVSPKKTNAKKRPPGHVRRGEFGGYRKDSTPTLDPLRNTCSDLSSEHAGDLATLPRREVPVPAAAPDISKALEVMKDLSERPASNLEPKVDSKTDFQSFLRAANASSDEDIFRPIDYVASSSGAQAPKSLAHAFGGISSGGGNRRYATAPSSTLSTIREVFEGEDALSNLYDSIEMLNINDNAASFSRDKPVFSSHDVEERVVNDSSSTGASSDTNVFSKKMRIPKVKKGGSLQMDTEQQLSMNAQNRNVPKIATSDEEIESMGDVFLDNIGTFLGVSSSPTHDGEEKRVGAAHHRRRTRGKSSIDWSISPSEERSSPTPSSSSLEENNQAQRMENESDETMSTLRKEHASTIPLPSFVDRLAQIGKSSSENARWFPFAYEVIIMQWSAILVEQRNGEKGLASNANHLDSMKDNLREAASRSVGVAVASAPMLFEVIKKSLGYRVKTLFKEVLWKKGLRVVPPLVALDETLMVNLIQVISMVTDACIDSRNFDSWDLRQASIDVNDAIIRFLRDLFSFLAPAYVHRLIMIYLSRFLTKEGKHFADRDSLIGLRCSWEITKLRLNAISALVRFPDFIRVSSPQMLNWNEWWTTPSYRASARFSDEMLERYHRLKLPGFAVGIGGAHTETAIPVLQPHWLAEIAVDVCLLGTEHAEQYIQYRSAALLQELFWSCSQESILYGISAPVAGMFLTLLEKLVSNTPYLSNFPPKSQIRRGVLTCGVFVMQSAPSNLLRALWRRLCHRLPGKGLDKKYGGLGEDSSEEVDEEDEENHGSRLHCSEKEKDEPDVLGMFSLLNLSLRTIEYEGNDSSVEGEGESEDIELWRKDYLLCLTEEGKERNKCILSKNEKALEPDYTSSASRKWQAHDGSMVIINTGHQIVREMFAILNKSISGKCLLNPEVTRSHGYPGRERSDSIGHSPNITISRADTIVFVRAAASLYLHALALRESDILISKTLWYSAELIKIFGIQIFLEAVGETLQHWMRVISLHCGARRAQVRIHATDLLELVLRSTWECFGSFFRIRLPLLAVQTEVMERIVAIAAAKYYKEQRRVGTSFETFTSLGAEASLVPLWRTLDRIQKQPASQNVAFRGALIRIAGKLKKLYRAYVAARVLSFVKSSTDKTINDENASNREDENRNFETEAQDRAYRINILRVINQSEGFSKQFLGFQGTTQNRTVIANCEAVEDALIDAANVFSPTELPEHRVAWLRMLAEFHNSRRRHAEEATCHYFIHVTLNQAARLHGSLWSNTPFLPWTDNIPDPIVYIDSDTGPAQDPDTQSEYNFDTSDWENNQMENTYSFRRIFYRVANSITMGNNEWETAGSKNLFYGITFPHEYHSISPWITLREMEESMIEEVEAAGSLFLKAGIVESSRFAWNLATQFYSEKFNYAKLNIAYANLQTAIISRVPQIDATLPLEVSSTLGRFFRVWFHGGAPDDLSGVEFVYRTQDTIRMKEFGDQLQEVIRSILPSIAPIHLTMDGFPEQTVDEQTSGALRFSHQTPVEPVRIKITPLRPLFGKNSISRGHPEWFNRYVDEAFSSLIHRSKNDLSFRGIVRLHEPSSANAFETPMSHHDHNQSFSATMFSSGSGSTIAYGGRNIIQTTAHSIPGRGIHFAAPKESDLAGVDKFCFVQPKDRSRPREWWKPSSGDFAEKSLRVTQLQTAESFPACVGRQEVVHRLVYTQTPLEAGIDVVCQWCSVLYRTAVSTVGMSVLKLNVDPGIGTDAAKVVADCIHNSHVKEIGLSLLRDRSELGGDERKPESTHDHDHISDEEIAKLQLKLARLIVTFVELLHLLIARNRDKLLSVIQERKKSTGDSAVAQGGVGTSRGYNRTSSHGANSARKSSAGQPPIDPNYRGRSQSYGNVSNHRRQNTDDTNRSDTGRSDDGRSRAQLPSLSADDAQSVHSTLTTSGTRTESAIAVQSELQRAFISLCKALYQNVHNIMHSATPKWLKQCGQDNYFSLGTYKQTKIPIAEELCFTASEGVGPSDNSVSHHPFVHAIVNPGQGYESERCSADGSQSSVVSRTSDRYSSGNFIV